jgi:hypothetical protein
VRTWVRRVACLVFAASANAGLCAQEAASSDSLDRVRAKLDKPPSKLTLQQRTPDFSVHIEKRRPMQDIFDVPPWATDPVGWQPPALGFDLLGAFRSVAKSIADAKRGHDERLAREEVQRAIADFCAAQPATDDRRSTAAQTCSTSPAIR